MANRLASETSPYLRQHADNPVDWWPWGDEAWEEARRSDRPVLLSIGYSACHWCHVMAHESFENAETAELQNRLFVNIKVDREERPDVDSVYMSALQAMSGQGGWPLTVFCSPRGVPYFGGTYFPPEDRHGMRGFPTVLRAAEQAYREQRDAVERTGDQLRQALTPPRLRAGDGIDVVQLDQACRVLAEQTDRRYGGFGRAPKFPHPGALDLLLRRHLATGDRSHLETALISLDRMARGGIHDQVGGGFHRYSVDAQWAVPHFEKMLYDNAQLAPVYLHAWQLTGETRWREVCTDTLDWALREMRLSGGGFASSQDADSGGVEGSFFVWTPDQLREVLGDEDGVLAARLFGVVPQGNFEDGTTVLSMPYPLEVVARAIGDDEGSLHARLIDIRGRLYTARAQRVHPGRDDKVLTAWNGMLLRALAEAGVALDRQDYIDAARTCARFLLTQLVRDGVVMRSWMDGDSRVRGFLEDYATLADSLLTLYEATGDAGDFSAARGIADTMLERFLDPVAGFYDTPVDGEPLMVRPSTLDDNAVPAGRSTAALMLLRLHGLTAEQRYLDVAMSTIEPLASAIARSPLGLANLAWALDTAIHGITEVAVVSGNDAPGARSLLAAIRESWRPNTVLAHGNADGVPLLAGRPAAGDTLAYVCRNFACDAPTGDPQTLREQLSAARP
jgi:uncharacterized protein YyaL (SSP411 family)